MQIDEFLELARKRRSIRSFKPDPIPDEYIGKILEAAHWAMSGANGQPWEFVVVRDAETRRKIIEIMGEKREQSRLIETSRVEEMRHVQFTLSPETYKSPMDAPVIIVVCGDQRTFQATVLATHFVNIDAAANTYHQNMGNATMMIHLAAAALGLGSRWVSVTTVQGKLKTLLGIPDVFTIYTVVPVGYPAYEPAPPYRRELDEIVHWDRYDQSKYRSDEAIRDFIIDLRKRSRPAYAV